MIKIFGFNKIDPPIPLWEIQEEVQSKLSHEVLDKIYTEGELRFNSTVYDISQLRSRAYSLITVFISLLSVLISLCFGNYLDFQLSDIQIFLYVVNIIMIAYFIIQLIIIVFPNKIMLKGEEPKLMNFEGMASLSTKEQNEIYLFNSIHAIQGKIEYNEAVLANKNDRFESIIFLTAFLFVFTIFLELIIKIF